MKNFQQRAPEGRNLERDKRSFLETIENTSVAEISTKFDEQSAQTLASNLDSTKLFLLGEMHGVKENADVIYTLFKKFGFRNLALEWETRLKEVAEKFLETGELNFELIKESPDGRITAGHFSLLKKLKTEGMLERLVCFDGDSGGGTWDDRDAAMAKGILQNLSDTPTLAIAGNLHTKVGPITFENESNEHHPMGESVKRQLPAINSGKIDYLSGEYHNCGTRKFEKLIEREIPLSARFYESADGLYIFELPVAHIAVVPNPSERI